MKQCLICRTLFADENLKFCRFDGSQLSETVVKPDEAATILFTTEQLSQLLPALDELRPISGSGKLYE